jgi:hypothetical protein
MGAVIVFPEARRALRAQRCDATVIILPVVRIERENDESSHAGTETSDRTSTRTSARTSARTSGRKRRRRAQRT